MLVGRNSHSFVSLNFFQRSGRRYVPGTVFNLLFGVVRRIKAVMGSVDLPLLYFLWKLLSLCIAGVVLNSKFGQPSLRARAWRLAFNCVKSYFSASIATWPDWWRILIIHHGLGSWPRNCWLLILPLNLGMGTNRENAIPFMAEPQAKPLTQMN